MRGRKPKPTTSQIAAGDPRKLGARKLAAKLEAEPKAARGLPSCPRHIACCRPEGNCGKCIQCLARAAWAFWAEELEAMGLDRRPDGMMLEGACYNYGGAIDAENIIGREGATITESSVDEESGEVVVLRVKAHPAVQIARQRWTLVKGFCSEFGLSPVSRTRLSIEKKDEGDADLMAMLSGPRETREAVN